MDTNDADAHDRADMERLIAGHDPALDDLMQRHAAPVFRFLCRMLANEDDANDLAQEAFFRIYRARASFRTSERFSTWLYTIAANLARNHFRWRTRHPNVRLMPKRTRRGKALATSCRPISCHRAKPALATERAAAVRAAVSRLPEDLREAIVLCEWEERSMAEAAAILDTTPKAIESRLYRARQLLRERLKNWL
jgi:RNA polymerase sigma-70 factor (ECF subfamily)